MTTNLIISAHCDDGPFSMGSYIAYRPQELFIIVSPFDGIPSDDKGTKKHTTLNDEHKKACSIFPNVKIISGPFLDDVYESTRELTNLTNWFLNVITQQIESSGSFKTFVPLAIHHKDHVICRDIFINNFRIDAFYVELPYYLRYPYLKMNLETLLCSNRTLETTPHHILKEIACKKYESQTDEEVLRDLFVEERIWK